MLDYGYSPDVLMNNMEVIGIDPTKPQALIRQPDAEQYRCAA